jgi:hypothetical protein
MELERWHPSNVGDRLTGRYGRQGGDAVIQTDDGLLWMVPHEAEAALGTIDPDIGGRVTLTYRGRDPAGNELFTVAANG